MHRVTRIESIRRNGLPAGIRLPARRYDTPWIQRWFYRPPQDAILEELRVRGSPRIIDVGFGTGILADRIQRELQADEVIGVDPSEGRLSKAKARSSAVRWIVGPAEKLPLPDDSVDAVPSTTAFSSSISPPPSRNSAGCSHQAESLPSGQSPSRCPRLSPSSGSSGGGSPLGLLRRVDVAFWMAATESK